MVKKIGFIISKYIFFYYYLDFGLKSGPDTFLTGFNSSGHKTAVTPTNNQQINSVKAPFYVHVYF